MFASLLLAAFVGSQANGAIPSSDQVQDQFAQYEARSIVPLRMMMLAGEAQGCGIRTTQWAFQVMATIEEGLYELATTIWHQQSDKGVLLASWTRMGSMIGGAYSAGLAITTPECNNLLHEENFSPLDGLAEDAARLGKPP